MYLYNNGFVGASTWYLIYVVLTNRTNTHDDVIKWKHFHVTRLLCGDFTGDRWIPLTPNKFQWRAALMFFFSFDLRLN